MHPPNNEGLFFTTQNRVTTLAPQGKESARGQGELTLSGMVALGVGWAQGSWEGASGYTWAASPLKGLRDGIRSGWAYLPPDGHPTCPLSLKAGPELLVAPGE